MAEKEEKLNELFSLVRQHEPHLLRKRSDARAYSRLREETIGILIKTYKEWNNKPETRPIGTEPSIDTPRQRPG